MSIPDRPLMPFRPLAWVTVKATGEKAQVDRCILNSDETWSFEVVLQDMYMRECKSDELE